MITFIYLVYVSILSIKTDFMPDFNDLFIMFVILPGVFLSCIFRVHWIVAAYLTWEVLLFYGNWWILIIFAIVLTVDYNLKHVKGLKYTWKLLHK